jgi:hypothetical protein
MWAIKILLSYKTVCKSGRLKKQERGKILAQEALDQEAIVAQETIDQVSPASIRTILP